MIIPIRCFTCNNKIANKWELYNKLLDGKKDEKKEYILTTEIIKDIKENEKSEKIKSNIGQVLDTIGITRYCCRRHFIGHVELIHLI